MANKWYQPERAKAMAMKRVDAARMLIGKSFLYIETKVKYCMDIYIILL